MLKALFNTLPIYIHVSNFSEYYRNIRIVDAGIKNISEMIEKYYNNDDKTAFLVTADHGMTNWGESKLKRTFLYL